LGQKATTGDSDSDGGGITGLSIGLTKKGEKNPLGAH
jgi:hypothetical protein